ncbi:hypothetical protein [Lentzea sp. NPDC055074]
MITRPRNGFADGLTPVRHGVRQAVPLLDGHLGVTPALLEEVVDTWICAP